MLGLLYQHNHRNRMAFEYMLAYVLQQRDLERFMKYYPLGKHAGYDHIPRSYQEALIYVWTSQQNARQMLEARFGSTYWNYLLLRK